MVDRVNLIHFEIFRNYKIVDEKWIKLTISTNHAYNYRNDLILLQTKLDQNLCALDQKLTSSQDLIFPNGSSAMLTQQ